VRRNSRGGRSSVVGGFRRRRLQAPTDQISFGHLIAAWRPLLRGGDGFRRRRLQAPTDQVSLGHLIAAWRPLLRGGDGFRRRRLQAPTDQISLGHLIAAWRPLLRGGDGFRRRRLQAPTDQVSLGHLIAAWRPLLRGGDGFRRRRLQAPTCINRSARRHPNADNVRYPRPARHAADSLRYSGLRQSDHRHAVQRGRKTRVATGARLCCRCF